MLFRPETYFRHFPVAPLFDAWGMCVTATGYASIPPGAPYPPAIHPEDHLVDWSRGRVLDCCQIVLLTAGRGSFETGATGRRRVRAGEAFLLLPGVRHSYAPDPNTGWDESWIELRGTNLDTLREAGVLSADNAIRKDGAAGALAASMAAVHARVFEAVPGFDPELIARAVRVLAAWAESARKRPTPTRVAAAVGKAERYLAQNLTQPVNMEALSQELGVAYSHFRRAFKDHTGFSPWQYVLQLRLMRARRLLSESDARLEDVAAGLGFNSAFHLSTCFKQAFGVSPSQWRKPFAAADIALASSAVSAT